MFDENLLKPVNMCPYMGLEKPVKHVFGKSVKIFECKETRKIRLVAYKLTGEAMAGLLLNPYGRIRTYQIDALYTSKEFRRHGVAKQLLAVARFTFGTVHHSDNLTDDGRKWRDSVEGIKTK